MRRNALAMAALAVLVVYPLSIFAGSTGSFVTVTAIDQRNDGKFLLNLSAPIQDSSCATVLDRVTGDASTPAGRTLLQVAMSAFLSGKRVYIETTNSCSEYGGIDSVSRIYISAN